jgi:hypothetical protein
MILGRFQAVLAHTAAGLWSTSSYQGEKIIFTICNILYLEINIVKYSLVYPSRLFQKDVTLAIGPRFRVYDSWFTPSKYLWSQ